MGSVVLAANNLTKQFPGVLAVDRANLTIERGKVHAIVGGNGAGKSTLMKIFSGIYTNGTYEGDFYLNGKICEFQSVIEAETKGIAMVPQELNMANNLSVADNLFLNKYPGENGLINTLEMYDTAQKIIDEFKIEAQPNTRVAELGIAQKQLIVIARAMHNQTKVILLDEPTSTLSDSESKLLFNKIREIKECGIACIYISHRLEEVRSIADTLTVMRDGKILKTAPIEEMDDERIVSLMVGKNLSDFYPSRNRKPGDIVMSVNSISVYDSKLPDRKIVDDVNFDLHAGEILAVYGLVGSGRSEMTLGLIGAWNGGVEKDISIFGKRAELKNPSDAIKSGVGFLPEDRKNQGIIERLNVGTNISVSGLENVANTGIIDDLKERNKSQDLIETLSIKTNSMDSPIETLSGGNQQKCILARLIAANSSILILDEATQGVDVEAKSQIYNILDDLARNGKAIIFISSDLSEVLGVADRIMIMRHGNVVKILDIKEADRQKIVWHATIGVKEENEYDKFNHCN